MHEVVFSCVLFRRQTRRLIERSHLVGKAANQALSKIGAVLPQPLRGSIDAATLVVPPDTDGERAHRLLEKAEAGCLVTNSLSAEIHLDATVTKAT